jgi:glycosyltransferase involved in cell wall biosynthesis
MTLHPPSLTVFVTAMNEEGNLRPTVENILTALRAHLSDYEVLIIDDGSRDRTGEIADALAAANPHVHVHRNDRNRGLAFSYRKGMQLASKEFTCWIAGNNIIPLQAMHDMFARVGEHDLIMTYVERDVRGFSRRAISVVFCAVVNTLFGLRIRYYTGPCVYRTRVAQALHTIGEGSTIVPEVLIRLVKSGQQYIEIGLMPRARTAGATKTFRIRNIVRVARSILALFWDLQVRPLASGRREPGLERP